MGRIKEFLQERKENNLLRTLHPALRRKDGRISFKEGEYTDFSSNDYLGLSNHPEITEAAKKCTDKYGTGSSASRLLSGDSRLYHRLEEKLARFKGAEASLVYNSGYQANLGLISALVKKGDAIFSDKLNHASIIDGALLSGAKMFRFRHNDAAHLESLLEKERNNFKEALIVTETVFSMDGDTSPLNELVKLKEEYNSKIMVDEAHATGIFGEKGAGMTDRKDLRGRIDLVMGTFSKALGSFGAYVGCSSEIREYLINASRSFIYSTSLPPAVIAANIASLEVIKKEPFRRKELLRKADHLRGGLVKKGFSVRGSSQIIPVILGDNEKAVKVASLLRERGHWTLPIRTPTVPKGEARLRLSVTYKHTKEAIDGLLEDIDEANKI